MTNQVYLTISHNTMFCMKGLPSKVPKKKLYCFIVSVWHNETVKKILCFLSLFVMFSFSVFSQTKEDTNLNNERKQSEIILGTSDITVPTNQGLAIIIKGNGWNFNVANSTISNINAFITLASIEDTQLNTRFLFYRIKDGRDALHFRRFDTVTNTIYSYVLWIDWKNNYVYEDTFLFKDKYIQVDLILETLEDYGNTISNTRMKVKNNPNTSNNTSNNGTELANIPTKITIETPIQKNIVTSAPKNTIQTINSITNNKENSKPIDEMNIMENENVTLDKENSVDFSENAYSTPNDTNELAKTESTTAIEHMTLEEFQNHLYAVWDTMEYDILIDEINRWITTINDMFASASILWQYGQHIEASLRTADDINNVYSLYTTIVEQYPLSLEYFEASATREKLKKQYIFVLK